MSAPGRFCCRSLLKRVEVGDSVAVVRFATGAEHDGAAQPRAGTIFLFGLMMRSLGITLFSGSPRYLIWAGSIPNWRPIALGLAVRAREGGVLKFFARRFAIRNARLSRCGCTNPL